MAEIVFPCSCGMLLKVHGDDQVGHGIVCPSCGGTATVPAVGIAVDPEEPLFLDSPPEPPATSKGGKWFGLVYLAGISAVTVGLVKFVLMPAIATPPVTVAQADPAADEKPDADDAPRHLLTKPRPGRPRYIPSRRRRPRPRNRPRREGPNRSRMVLATRHSNPRVRAVHLAPALATAPAPGPDPVPDRAPAAPRGPAKIADATPKTDAPPIPPKASPRTGPVASGTGGPAKARRVTKDEMSTKTADNPAAKKAEKRQDPAARVRTLMNLAFNLEVQQNYEGALEYYREVTTKFPDAPEAKKAADRVRALEVK